LKFPKKVVLRTLKHLKNIKDKNLIAINVIEFVIVPITYCAASTVVITEHVTVDSRPVLTAPQPMCEIQAHERPEELEDS
jgi:hypothetical protein